MKSVLLVIIILLLSLPVSASDLMSVAFSGADIRSAPTATAAKARFAAPKYAPLTVMTEEKEYYKVSDYRGRTGYIHKSLLSQAPAVIVTADRANVRSGPGTDHEVLFQLSSADSALLIGRSDNWLEIKTATGQSGWIADFLVWGD